MKTLKIATKNYATQQSIDFNPREHIELSSLEYLHAAFLLYECKETYSRKKYQMLLEEYGWDKGSVEEKKSLKIGESFQAFVNKPEQLAVLPMWVLHKLCSENYKVLIEQLNNIPIGGLTCEFVLGLIESRRLFLKSQNQEKKDGNWRAAPDGSRYYNFGKIIEDDEMTGMKTDMLIKLFGLTAQQIARIAIADLYNKILKEIRIKNHSPMPDSEASNSVEDLREDIADANNEVNWKLKQLELESLLQHIDTESNTDIELDIDTESYRDVELDIHTESNTDNEFGIDTEQEEEYTCSEYLEEPEESDFDFEDDEVEVVENIEQETAEILATNQIPLTDAEILADILRNASDYSEVRRALYQYQAVKMEAWKLLSIQEREYLKTLIPEKTKKLSEAQHAGFIINFYEVESGGIYKILTVDNPLVEETVSNSYLDEWLVELKARLSCYSN
jgi:hypothetical protein